MEQNKREIQKKKAPVGCERESETLAMLRLMYQHSHTQLELRVGCTYVSSAGGKEW